MGSSNAYNQLNVQLEISGVQNGQSGEEGAEQEEDRAAVENKQATKTTNNMDNRYVWRSGRCDLRPRKERNYSHLFTTWTDARTKPEVHATGNKTVHPYSVEGTKITEYDHPYCVVNTKITEDDHQSAILETLEKWEVAVFDI